MLADSLHAHSNTWLFGSCSKAEFINEYFNKKPLLVTQAIPNPDDLLDVKGFYAALRHTENVRAIFRSMHRASIAPNDAEDMFSAGATICATGIDLAVPAVRDLVQGTGADLGYLGTVSANAYCSPGGSGLSKHYDPRIVTVVQLVGSKQWEFSLAPYEVNPTGVAYNDESREVLLQQHNDKVGTRIVTLSPGDVLCLPAGTVHEACAESPSLSLNVAFDYIGRGVADLITEWLRTELAKSPKFREPCFTGEAASQQECLVLAIESVQTIMSELRLQPQLCLPKTNG